MTDWMNAKERIRQTAREAGFPLCGFTSPDPPADYPRYADWIAAGHHADMNYLAGSHGCAGRANPLALLPEARTILMLAAPYPKPAAAGMPDGGRVAGYAVGDDYHDVLPPRLQAICRAIDDLAGRRLAHKVYTDTGPILERELASRAGLGWIGRNSMLIHPAFGSFFFLAEILTEYALPPDPPFTADRCGQCDRCLRACPTKCILPDRTIDSGKCLAWLTIEHRGFVPADLRHSAGDRVFGCDECQIVCPWNAKPRPAIDPHFQPRPFFPIMDLGRELSLSEDEITARMRGSALRRIGKTGYRRNLVLALSNSPVEAKWDALRIARSDQDPVVRELAEAVSTKER
jgi:epoxyqueuosine reductase